MEREEREVLSGGAGGQNVHVTPDLESELRRSQRVFVCHRGNDGFASCSLSDGFSRGPGPVLRGDVVLRPAAEMDIFFPIK